MKQPLYLLLFFLLSSANAAELRKGDKLPDIVIKQKGEISIGNKNRKIYKPWYSKELRGKKHIIQYLPGRLISGRENLSLNDAVYEIDHPRYCRTVTIVNYDVALPGTEVFIEPSLVKGKKQTPLCEIVADLYGIGANAWHIDEPNNTTIAIDEKGTILFYHEGKLSQQQIKMLVNLTAPD